MKKKAAILIIVLAVIYWIPFLTTILMAQKNIVNTVGALPPSDTVIIFGAHITEENEVTPILKERLDAGIKILQAGKARKIVASNTKDATNVMVKYLINQGIPANLIERDIQADKTPDTCKYELKQHPEKRKLIFVSQGFHVPRLLFQCKKEGVEGIGFPAETLKTTDLSQYSLPTKFWTRVERYTREAGLIWFIILNIY